jgi:hypothetical protein
VHAKLTHRWIDRDHFRRKVRWNMKALGRSENVELTGIEDQLFVVSRRQRLPEIANIVIIDAIDIQDIGMFLRAIADAIMSECLFVQCDAQDQPTPDIELTID